MTEPDTTAAQNYPVPLTEIAYILDQSGSMSSMRSAAIDAFNEFIKAQLDVPGDANLTLVLFDDRYEVPVSQTPVERVAALTPKTYTPRGNTALLDAIGRTINDFHARIDRLPADQKPAKVIMAIFTDGEENSSYHFTGRQISDLIRRFIDKHSWEFIFLAANQDAIASAAAMNMDRHNSGNVPFTDEGLTRSSKALHRKIRAMRMRSMGLSDAESLHSEATSMECLIQEEDAQPSPPPQRSDSPDPAK